jgi:prepilin-type N-terminal cleavage/methylation domain-containing protein
MYFRYSDKRGFTLIEIMIVVCIIGILTALAIPRFMTATTKTKQSEAKLILKQIYVNQRTYLQQAGQYHVPGGDASKDNPDAFSEIWIQIMEDADYVYSITSTDPNRDFLATATANIDDDEVDDVWTMDQDGNLVNSTNDIVEDGT